jgi:hypothetical protein
MVMCCATDLEAFQVRKFVSNNDAAGSYCTPESASCCVRGHCSQRKACGNDELEYDDRGYLLQ